MYPLIHIFGRAIGTYGLCILIGIALAVLLTYRKGKSKGLLAEDVFIVAAVAMGFAMIGGGLLYVLVTYTPAQILVFVQRGDFRFLGSGLVYYGGLIGGILGAVIGVRIANCSIDLVIRSAVPFLPLAHAVGRIGCIMAGCCHGFAYDGPLALYYPHAVSGLSPEQGYFPVQLLEALINVIIGAVLLRLEKKVRRPANLLLAYLSMYAIARFALEFFRGDAARGIYWGLSVSQWISFLLLLSCGTYGLIKRNEPL